MRNVKFAFVFFVLAMGSPALGACLFFAWEWNTHEAFVDGNSQKDPMAEHLVSGEKSSVLRKDKTAQGFGDFEARCRAPGVLVCEGFDSPAKFVPAKWPASGLYPAGDHAIRGSLDTKYKASGSGSLRFEIPSHSGSNASGYWRQRIGLNFGEGTTLYVQFRQRFSKEMLTNKWGDTSWKQVIIHNESATCDTLGLTTANYYSDGFPIMYSECGARGLYTNDGNPPTMLQQGDYNCWYGQYNRKDCFYYLADEWVAFYYQISVGHWGKADSTVNAWVALDGQPYKQWIKMARFVLKNDHPGKDFDTVTLLAYMTNKSETIDHPTAYTWFDDLIVSTHPIAPPTLSADKSAH